MIGPAGVPSPLDLLGDVNPEDVRAAVAATDALTGSPSPANGPIAPCR